MSFFVLKVFGVMTTISIAKGLELDPDELTQEQIGKNKKNIFNLETDTILLGTCFGGKNLICVHNLYTY